MFRRSAASPRRTWQLLFNASRRPDPTAPLTRIVLQLERHGASYPTDGATERILAALRKVQVVKKQEWRNAKLRLIESYKYDLGVADVLTFGAHQ